MSNIIYYQLLDASREPGCPVCRVVQHSVERYIENQFYENVNSPKWREKLRGSLGFCHEHSWLAVEHRLGDPLGFSIIYRDLINNVLTRMEKGERPAGSNRHWASLLRQVPEQTRNLVENALYAITPGRHCPVCDHRDETTQAVASVLLDGLQKRDFEDVLRSSDGLCLPHMQSSLAIVKNKSTCEALLSIQREKLQSLKAELEEFIRKSDYREISEGFGKEGDAWLRAMALVAGNKRQ